MSVEQIQTISPEEARFASSDRVLSIGGHPDDIEVMESGLVYQATSIISTEYGGYAGSVVLTKGKNSTKGNREIVLNGLRAEETKMALGEVGLLAANIFVLDIEDGGVEAQYDDARKELFDIAYVNRINKIITLGRHGGGDGHRDHEVSHMVADDVAQELGIMVYALNSDGEGDFVVVIDKDMRQRKLKMMSINHTQWPIRSLLKGEQVPEGWFNRYGYIFPGELKEELDQYTQYFNRETYDVYTYGSTTN